MESFQLNGIDMDSVKLTQKGVIERLGKGYRIMSETPAKSLVDSHLYTSIGAQGQIFQFMDCCTKLQETG